jgi:hypothetical protein
VAYDSLTRAPDTTMVAPMITYLIRIYDDDSEYLDTVGVPIINESNMDV